MKSAFLSLAALVSAGTASAATISQTTEFVSTVENSPFGGRFFPLNVSVFDQSLGNLTGASIKFDASYDLQASWDQSTMQSGVIYWYGGFKAIAWMDVDMLPHAPLGTSITPDSNPLFMGEIKPGEIGQFHYTGAHSAGFDIHPDDLALLGPSSFQNAYLFEEYLIFFECLSMTCAPGIEVAGTANYKITMTYQYEPNAVPEPATWGLMIVGFGIMGCAMRRRLTRQAGALSFV